MEEKEIRLMEEKESRDKSKPEGIKMYKTMRKMWNRKKDENLSPDLKNLLQEYQSPNMQLCL